MSAWVATSALGVVPAARAEGTAPVAVVAPAPAPPPPEGTRVSTGMAIGGGVVGTLGLGATGLGVFLTAKGSTLDCLQCEDSNDEAPLVVGGLSVVVLGLGLAAAGGTMVVLGLREAPTGIRVTELRASPSGASIVGRF